MDAGKRAEELLQKIDLMKRCYFKGFGNGITIIRCKCEYYLEHPNSGTKDTALEILSRLENNYKSIPFDMLESDEDFNPLFIVRDVLPVFSEKVREFFKNPGNELYEIIFDHGVTIHEDGILYKKTLCENSMI